MAKFNLYKTLQQDLEIDTLNRTVSVRPKLNTKNYGQVKSILNRLGGQWVSQEQQFNFKKCPQALIDRVLEVGSGRLNRFHFYPTPQEVFDYMTNFTALNYFGASQDEVKVLEPSCGEGSLIKKLMKYGEQENRNFVIKGYDIDPLNVIFCTEAGLDVEQADFLKVKPVADQDILILNPPFNNEEFIKHIQHAQKFLKEDGLLISVIPTQWLEKLDGKENLLWLLEQAQIDSTSDLYSANFFKAGTFKGVSAETTVVCLQSSVAADRMLNRQHYKVNAVNDFCHYIDNHPMYLSQLEVLKENELDHSNIEIEIYKIVDAIFSNDTDDTDCSDETVHLVRRFRTQYCEELMKMFFPETKRELFRAPIEQLGFGELFGTSEVA